MYLSLDIQIAAVGVPARPTSALGVIDAGKLTCTPIKF